MLLSGVKRETMPSTFFLISGVSPGTLEGTYSTEKLEKRSGKTIRALRTILTA